MPLALPRTLVGSALLLAVCAACAGRDGPARQVAPEAVRSAEMARIRDAVVRAPQQALTLIARDDALHGGDEHAEERAWLTVDALVAARQIGRARAAAEDFLRRYPESAQGERIRALTGVHLRPLGPRE
jgi:hypothetical protein